MRVARHYASLSKSTEVVRGRIDDPEAIASVAATSWRLHRAIVEPLQADGEIAVLAQPDPVVRVMSMDRDRGSVGAADSEDRE